MPSLMKRPTLNQLFFRVSSSEMNRAGRVFTSYMGRFGMSGGRGEGGSFSIVLPLLD